MGRTVIYKTDEVAALTAIKNTYFPTGKDSLVKDDTVVPPIDEITAYTDALAARATTVNPDIKYPGQPK